MSIFKALLTFLSLLLLTLTAYILFKNNYKKEKLPREVIHIKQMVLPKTNENEKTILSHLKQYIDKNKQYTDSIQTNENKILEELKIFTSQNISQEEIIKSIKDESSLIKQEIQTLSLNINQKIDKEVKILKKDIKKNSNKIHKKITILNKKTINKIEQTNGVFSSAYELKTNEKSLRFGEIETINTSIAYKMDDIAPIHSPIDVSVENTDSMEELNFVQTLGVVNVSKPYLSTDEVM